MSFVLDTRRFEQAVKDLAAISRRSDAEILERNGQTLLRRLAYRTPKDTGTSRAGWFPAWSALRLPGSPYTRQPLGQTVKRSGRQYVSAGTFERVQVGPFATALNFINRSHYTERDGKRVDYIYIQNDQTAFMQRAVDETAFRFEQLYERNLARYSGRAAA